MVQSARTPLPDTIESAPSPGQPTGTVGDLRKEYVAGGALTWYTTYAQALSWAIDDVTADFGDDLYERMMLDGHVAGTIDSVRADILEDGLTLSPAVLDAADPDHARSQQIADFCTQVLHDLQPALSDTLWDMLGAMCYGNRVAEKVYALQTDAHGVQRLALTALKVKPRRATAFVIDPFTNILGLLALIPGQAVPVQTGLLVTDPQTQPNFLRRSKFAILTWRPRNSDPRGTSILRPAYMAFFEKNQLRPENLKGLSQFGTPSVVGNADPNALPEVQLDGSLLTPVQVLKEQLAIFRNGSYLSLPPGAKVAILQSAHDGGLVQAWMDHCDREISYAITYQTLSSMDSKHGTRAMASVHKDTRATLIRQGKQCITRMVEQDLLRQLVGYNFPNAEHLIPTATLGETEQPDMAGMITAVAALATSQYFAPSQLPAVDEMLGFPVREAEEVQLLADAQKQAALPPPAPIIQAPPPPELPTPPVPQGPGQPPPPRQGGGVPNER